MENTGRRISTTTLLHLKEILPRTPWCYGLMVDPDAPALMALYMSMVTEPGSLDRLWDWFVSFYAMQ